MRVSVAQQTRHTVSMHDAGIHERTHRTHLDCGVEREHALVTLARGRVAANHYTVLRDRLRSSTTGYDARGYFVVRWSPIKENTHEPSFLGTHDNR